jgi:hypothetical protein
MKTTLRWSILFFLLASLPALACNALSGEDEAGPTLAATAVSTVEDGAQQTPTEAPQGDPGSADAPPLLEFGDLNEDLARFNSYRINVQMNFEESGDSGGSGTMSFSTARVLDPPASSVTIDISGDLAGELGEMAEGTSMSFTEIGDESYTVLPGFGCISGGGAGGAEAVQEFDDVLDTSDVIGEIEGAEFVGEETVNGIATYHYRFDENDVPQSDTDMRVLDGDVYVSKEDNYVVRMIVSGVGGLDVFGGESAEEGTIRMEYNVLDVGQPITIEAPPDCGESGSSHPVMEGASGLATFAGFTSYEVEASPESVVAFYREEMAALGYELSSEQGLGEDAALLTFSAEGQEDVSVTIGSENGVVTVLIASEGGGQ